MNINEFSINSLKKELNALDDYEDYLVNINDKRAYQIGLDLDGKTYFVMYNKYDDPIKLDDTPYQKQLGTSLLLEGVVSIMFKHYVTIMHKI